MDEIKKGDTVKCLNCKEHILLDDKTFIFDSEAEYIKCPHCGTMADIILYHCASGIGENAEPTKVIETTNEQHFDSLPKKEQERIYSFGRCALCDKVKTCLHIEFSPKEGYFYYTPYNYQWRCAYNTQQWANSEYKKEDAIWYCSKSWFDEWNLANQKVLYLEHRKNLFENEVKEHNSAFYLFSDDDKQKIIDFYNQAIDKDLERAKRQLKQLEEIKNS